MTREEAIEFIAQSVKNDVDMAKVADAIKTLEQEHVIEIKVGDEVTVEGVKGIVVRDPYPIGADNELFVLIWYGQRMSSNSLKNVAPTGRHFPQVMEVLEQLKRSC